MPKPKISTATLFDCLTILTAIVASALIITAEESSASKIDCPADQVVAVADAGVNQ